MGPAYGGPGVPHPWGVPEKKNPWFSELIFGMIAFLLEIWRQRFVFLTSFRGTAEMRTTPPQKKSAMHFTQVAGWL